MALYTSFEIYCMVQTHVSSLHMRGFKSFNNKASLELGPGLNCVVGPNGSGKSNILDAICFVLGRSSTKSIRAENIQDLIHKKKDAHVGSADVVFRLNNESKVFPIDAKHIELVRRITKEGQTKYYINGKKASRRQILELLSIARIHPEGHNIILQGDIDKFISMSPVEKRGIIEEIAGIAIYEQRKNDALRELGKVEDKLKEAKIILTEKETYLKGLESEKQQAEKFRSFNNELESAKATGLNLRLMSIKKKKIEIVYKFEKIEKAQKLFTNQIKDHEKKIDFLQDKISDVEEKIEKKGGEDQLELEHAISDLKLAVDNSNNIILSSKNEISRIEQRKKQLENSFLDINKKVSDKNKELNVLQKEKSGYEKREQQLTGFAKSSAKSIDDLDEMFNRKEKELDQLKSSKEKIKEQITNIESDFKITEYKLDEIKNKLDEINKNQAHLKNIHKGKDFYKSLLDKISKFTAEDSNLAIKLQDLRQKVDIKEELVAKLKIDSRATQELLMRDRAISQVLSSKKDIKGIIGTVASLGTSKKEFQQALAVAAGSKMRNVVVDNENVAIQALNLLKRTKSGVATFLPITKLNTRNLSDLSNQASRQPGVFGLASELINCDPKYKKVFQHVFRDTMIVQDSNTAKSLGIGKFNMVTVDGDVFSSSGAITGGFRRRDVGIKFAERDISARVNKEESELSVLKRELSRSEKSRNELQERIIKLRHEKAEIEGKLGSASISETDPSKVLQEHKDLLAKKKDIEREKIKLDKEEKSISDKINRAIIEKNAVSVKIKDLRFGAQSAEIKKLESSKRNVDARIATIKSVLENSLEPEQENIKKLLIHLEKEKLEFDEQINVEKKNTKENNITLDKKKKEEKEFYGSLKLLFADKKKFGDLLERENDRIKKIEGEMTGDDEERNALTIAKAKIEAEFAAFSEEFEPFRKSKILSHIKNQTQAKSRQEELKKKIENLGSVNMRALEIYDNVKKEFDNLTWRLDKLGSERDSVIGVINQIEHRKKDSFSGTFAGVNKHFQEIFSKISHKMQAQLILQNPDNPFDGGLNIRVRDKNGKGMFLGALSGGEKTLVALAFIFAVQEHSPAPFYLLDEIDAALDRLNSDKVAKLLQEYSKRAQVIIISHNDSIISAADNLYGIWMNKKGESFVNSLKI
jgi:chromosome segregation protein